MTSSSTEPRRWWDADRSTWVRLLVVLLLGLLAALAPAVGTTGAVYTDESPATTGVTTAPTFAPGP